MFEKLIHNHMFHQYGLIKGLQVFGEEGRQEAYREMDQLHLRNFFKPLHMYAITKEEKKK